MQSANYILKNFQTGLSQNHPKHGFLQVSQIIPLGFFALHLGYLFLNSIIYSCFCFLFSFKKIFWICWLNKAMKNIWIKKYKYIKIKCKRKNTMNLQMSE